MCLRRWTTAGPPGPDGGNDLCQLRRLRHAVGAEQRHTGLPSPGGPPLAPPLCCRAAVFDGEASQAVAGTYTPPALGPGKVGGIGSQLFSYTPIAPGTASITFAYKLDPPPTLSLVCAVSC